MTCVYKKEAIIYLLYHIGEQLGVSLSYSTVRTYNYRKLTAIKI